MFSPSLFLGLTIGERCLPAEATVTPLMTTSDSAFSKIAGYSLDTYEKEEGDIEGPFTLGVSIEERGRGDRLVYLLVLPG